MRISIRMGVAVAILCAALRGVYAFDVVSLPLHLYLSGIDQVKAPTIVEHHLVLSAAGPYRYVGAATKLWCGTGWSSMECGLRILPTQTGRGTAPRGA